MNKEYLRDFEEITYDAFKDISNSYLRAVSLNDYDLKDIRRNLIKDECMKTHGKKLEIFGSETEISILKLLNGKNNTYIYLFQEHNKKLTTHHEDLKKTNGFSKYFIKYIKI